MPSFPRLQVLAVAMVAIAAGDAAAQEAVAPLHERIDALIESGVAGTPSPIADDATFCRRAYLDFFGRVPSVAEARAFVADAAPDKRTRLIDALLAAPEFARQLAVWLDVTLMERRADKNVPTAEWRKYLFDSALANKPYDQLVREILSADGADPATRAAAKFYLDRDGEPFAVTRDVGRMLFGMDLQCAQCHDHPLISDYHQEDYHGLLAFLNRTTLFTDAESKVSLAEKADGETNYQSVFVPEQKGTIGPTLPGGLPLVEPALVAGHEYLVAPADKVRAVPKHSRRMLLATSATDGQNRAFNRNIANRMWAFVFGRGLVEPVDFQHSENPASQPEVLEMLADEIVASKYDLRALMRELALTRAYARALDLPEATPQLAADSANRRAECEQGCDAAKQRASEAAKIAADARAQAITARDAAQQTLTASQQAETAFAAAEQAVKDALAAMEAQRADLAVKQALVQTLTEAAAKTAEAAATLPDDQELASALATLKNRGEATAATIATLSQTMTQCQSDMGTKESAVAAQRETLNQCRAQWESAQSQQTTAVKAWQTAMQQAAIAEGTAAAAQRNLSELKALSSYQSAQEAVQANQATQAQALERLASVIASAKSPPAADPTMATVNNDLAGAQVVLASVRTRLSEQEKLAQQLTEAVAAVETVEASRAATLGAVDEAYAKLQSSWSERCLSAGISQLSPEQIAWSTWQALGVLEQQRAAAGAEWDAAHPADGSTETAEQRATARAAFVEQKVYDNLHGSVATFVNLFGGAPGQPQQVFQATADQALFFANSGELRSWLAPGGGNLTERLVALTDDQAFAEELYLALFTRAPAAEEIDMVRTYLAGRQQDRAAAVQEIVWALVTSSEFRFGT